MDDLTDGVINTEGVATTVDSTRETTISVMMLPLLDPFVEDNRHFNEPFHLFKCRSESLANATRSDMVNVMRMVCEILRDPKHTSLAGSGFKIERKF